MTKFESNTILLPIALVIAIVAFIYRGDISNLINPNACHYTADLSIVGLDAQPRPTFQDEVTKILTEHFAKGEEISAQFSKQGTNLVVEGGIKRMPKPETSDLSKKLGAESFAPLDVNTPAQAEATIRRVFSKLKPGRFGNYLSEPDLEARNSALKILKDRFPDLQLKPLDIGPLAVLPDLPNDTIQALRADPSAGSNHLFLIEFVHGNNVAANIYVVQSEPILTASSFSRAEIAEDELSFDERNRFLLALDFNADAASKLHDVTSKHIGGYLPLAIDSEAILVPTISGPISGSARLSMGTSTTDPTGELSARRVLLSINAGTRLNESLRFDLQNLKVTCE